MRCLIRIRVGSTGKLHVQLSLTAATVVFDARFALILKIMHQFWGWVGPLPPIKKQRPLIGGTHDRDRIGRSADCD
jgi:hypothetical protein